MKIFIHIHANNDLLCHEALSMAFALASFEHDIQLNIGECLFKNLVKEPNGKFASMLSSLDLYDMPKAWLSAEQFAKLSSVTLSCQNQLIQQPTTIEPFDTVFYL